MYWSIENRRCSFSTVLIFYRSSLPWSSATRLSRELLTAMILLSVSLQTVSCCSFRTNVISVIVPSFSFSTFLLILLSKLDTVPSFSAWNLQCLPSIFFTRASSSSLDISVLKCDPSVPDTSVHMCSFSMCSPSGDVVQSFCDRPSASHLTVIIFSCVCCFLFSSFLRSAMTMSFFIFVSLTSSFNWWWCQNSHLNTITCLH